MAADPEAGDPRIRPAGRFNRGAPGGSYDLLTGGLDVPCVHPAGIVTSSQTTASWVADLTPTGASRWVTGTSAPCTSLFKPVCVDIPLSLGSPTDRADLSSLWWRHEELHRRVIANPQQLLPLFPDEREDMERHWLADQPAPKEALTQGDDALKRWRARVAAADVADTRPGRVRRFWHRRNGRAGLRLEGIGTRLRPT